jgi:hypothetical protein
MVKMNKYSLDDRAPILILSSFACMRPLKCWGPCSAEHVKHALVRPCMLFDLVVEIRKNGTPKDALHVHTA